VSSEGLYFPLI
jgi:hypothetical protein